MGGESRIAASIAGGAKGTDIEFTIIVGREAGQGEGIAVGQNHCTRTRLEAERSILDNPLGRPCTVVPADGGRILGSGNGLQLVGGVT